MSAGLAHLAMYDLAEVRGAVDELWRAIAARLGPDAPAALTWPADIEAACRGPELVLGQTCGLPLVTALDGTVAVVGAFARTGASDPDAHYRSVLIARRAAPLVAQAGRVAAVNSWGSLSGWASFGAAVQAAVPGAAPARRTPFFRDVIVTGAHVASLRALADGRADVACIDGVTLALVRTHRPDALVGLHEIGCGPRIPCLPLVTAAGRDVLALRAAIRGALADPGTAGARRALLIEGFVPLGAPDYAIARRLAATARAVLPPPT